MLWFQVVVSKWAQLDAQDLDLRVRSRSLGSRIIVVLGLCTSKHERKVVLVEEIATRRRSHCGQLVLILVQLVLGCRFRVHNIIVRGRIRRVKA